MATTPRPRQVICVLGMHRSGTSYLTGSLQELGLELGKHHEWNPHNQKGNRENQDVVDLHDAILASNHGSWDAPPSRVRWQPEHIERAQAILAENADARYWGFKDPRALLVLSQWQKLVADIRFIGIYRHPLAVATSLQKRGKLPIDQGLKLWTQYNRKLLRAYKTSPFPLLCFDWDEQLLQRRLGHAAAALGLGKAAHSPTFYASELRHHHFSELDGLPWQVRRLYRQLEKISKLPPPG